MALQDHTSIRSMNAVVQVREENGQRVSMYPVDVNDRRDVQAYTSTIMQAICAGRTVVIQPLLPADTPER